MPKNYKSLLDNMFPLVHGKGPFINHVIFLKAFWNPDPPLHHPPSSFLILPLPPPIYWGDVIYEQDISMQITDYFGLELN